MATSAAAEEAVEATAGYVPPVAVSAAELLSRDVDDDALNRYKQSLLASANAIASQFSVWVVSFWLWLDQISVPEAPR